MVASKFEILWQPLLFALSGYEAAVWLPDADAQCIAHPKFTRRLNVEWRNEAVALMA